MLDCRSLAISGLFEIRPLRMGDNRGFFSEVWSRQAFSDAGLNIEFVQDNHSLSTQRGVLRGLHHQLPPAAQHKLVRATRGAIFDVAVDVRPASKTFGSWAGLILSAELWNQLLIPPGFAHGFVALEQDVEVQYKVSAPYRPDLERAIRFDDPQIGIDWPIESKDLIISERDRAAPLLSQADLPVEGM